MKQRAISSITVVVIGLTAAASGGVLFAFVLATLGGFAFRELRSLLRIPEGGVATIGFGVIGLAAVLPLVAGGERGFAILVTCAIGVPLTTSVFLSGDRLVEGWVAVCTGSLYIAVPVFAAVSLRDATGGERASWLDTIAGAMPLGVQDSGRGLALVLIALVVTWMTDTGAYLVGRSVGRTSLYARVSPNKTVEGGIGGLVAGALAALVLSLLFGLDINPIAAIGLGLLLGTVAMLGDLAESMIKRQRGVKDSGSAIPGHGGVLDRIDSLLVVLATTWLVLGM